MEQVKTQLIEDEMKKSYMDYAMSVIVSRALPDVRDGLKPVHRRILYAMNKLGLFHNKRFRKSAHVVGSVLASYHPHGDVAVYDSLVRMAQNFSLRYPLINGQGNWGSIDGHPAAAMRYTECKLKKIAEEILLDIDKDTVDFVENYDNSTTEPTVLPSRIPNLLVNGSSGIAVGMATNIPPHNIHEIVDALVYLIDKPQAEINELMQFVKGPDFPTGGLICGRSGIIDAYKTGRGRVVVKAKTKIEEGRIIVEEIPYMVNKSILLENIANLVKDKKIDGIKDLRDESDRRGLRIVIELKREANAEYILNNLMKQTQLMGTFGVIQLALVNGEPKVLNLKELLYNYLLHRKIVIERRSRFDLVKAEDRAHILVGLKKALENIDPIVRAIKSSENADAALRKLIDVFNLSEKQSKAILEMRLQKLTSLETNKLKEEYSGLLELIKKLKDILSSERNIMLVVKNELIEIKNDYSDERRSEIVEEEEEIEHEDLIKEEDVVIMVTNEGYIKQTPLSLYKQQKRGGKGIKGAATKEEDVIDDLFVTSNLNNLLCFTNKGRVHWLKAYEIPVSSRYSKGKAIVNLLNLGEGEKVNAVLPIKKFDNAHYLLFVTKNGVLKKSALNDYANPRKKGIIALKLKNNDEVVRVRLTPGNLEFILCTKKGQAVRFSESDVRSMGRGASGVRGIRVAKGDEVIGMEVAFDKASLLTITEKGYGKRTNMSEYRKIRRGGKGVTNIKISEKNGDVVGVKTVLDHDELMFISEKGVVIRVAAKDISCIGRNTQGVRVMRLKNDKLKGVARVVKNE